MSGLLALCSLALLVQQVVEADPNIGAHLVPGIIMLAMAVIVCCVPSQANSSAETHKE